MYVYLDVLNVLNRENVAGYDLDFWSVVPDPDPQLGILPVLGLTYRF
ncbi:MAG: hypothetical protein WBB73_04450 [Candidatus Aminicenantaceae bacterium]